ncbi:MAG: MFS transporter [Candidatus Babeliales bacterium]
MAYVSYQLAQTLFSFPAGIIADRVGVRTILMSGYILFAAISCTWAFMPEHNLVWILFPLYGMYMALTEGMSKAYIAELVAHKHLASAFGLHQALIGTCALFASWTAGILWTTISSSAPFFFSMTLALCAVVLFLLQPRLQANH